MRFRKFAVSVAFAALVLVLMTERASPVIIPGRRLTSLQAPDTQQTRSLTIEPPDGSVGLLVFAFFESTGGCTLPPSSGALPDPDPFPIFQDLPWVKAEPDNGSLPPGESGQVQVVFDSNGLKVGEAFQGTLCLDVVVNAEVGFQSFLEPVQVSLQVVPPVEEVPTLGVWGLFALAGLLVRLGVARL